MRSIRKIIHIDMDCFYAAVEIRDNPKLQGKPVAVGGDANKRGVLTTCNYEARAFGLHSAMPTITALQRCSHLILLPVTMQKYREASEKIQAIFRRYTESIEPLSLDEAYLDVTENEDCQGSATWLAQDIRQAIAQELQLTASAGIAPNKFLAKVASDWNKPNGQFVVAPQSIVSFMLDLPVKKIPGVGNVTAQKLFALGIEVCGQLQAFSQAELINKFGKFGDRLYGYCRGIDERPVQSSRIRKSLSVETTFVQNLMTIEDCLSQLPRLFQELLQRLKKHQARRIHKQFIKIKFSDFTQCTKECVIPALELTTFVSLLRQTWREDGLSIRLLGIGVRFAVHEDTSMQLDFLKSETSSE